MPSDSVSSRPLLLRTAAAIGLLVAPTLAQAVSDREFERWSGEVQTSSGSYSVEPEAVGLENPWGFAFLPDGAALITERPGRLRIALDRALGQPIGNVPDVFDSGQGGLLDVALDPEYENNGLIYLSFAQQAGRGAGTAVYKARLVRDGLNGQLEDGEVIFSQNVKTRGGRHFGSRITFDNDGHLFITVGDRGERDRAQNTKDHTGSVLRINTDGSIPRDNPFVGNPDYLDEIWSIGHRNPQGADLHPQTGDYWTVEHGARGGDELNQPEAGRNYGWPVISYGRHYSGLRIGEGTEKAGMEQPVHYWDPSIAPSGLLLYEGGAKAEWLGDAFVGALRGQLISHLDLETASGKSTVRSEEQWDMSKWGRVRDLDVDSAGNIWFLTDEADGGLYRIELAQ